MSNLDGFPTPQSLPGGASWTAEYESIDQRLNVAYYIVDHSEAGSFWAEVPVLGPDWIVSDGFRGWLHERLEVIASTGKPNTSYDGIWGTQMRLEKEGRAVASLELEHTNPLSPE